MERPSFWLASFKCSLPKISLNMASAFGLSSSQSSQTTYDNSVTAQDSEVINGQKAGSNAIAATDNAVVNVTDGGAFDVVKSAVKDIAGLLGSWTTQQNQFALSGTTALLDNARVSQQESALTSQENLLSFLKFAGGAAAVVGCVYLFTKYAK